jgi:excisionase family DNA binding protein
LTVPEVADRLRVSRVHVYRAVWRGALEAVRIGEAGPLRVPAQALESFIHPTVGGA